ncbi:Ubiquitin and WLM domain-containing metalloprotease [Neolecta irregularis DAH-3]|uniref:Ubiquitin and WLM domain-containing metalloprotease n=1 Tax=Neolecta irregularis (strain DAH-3) TaxID=1198029 RepID=A0A1U7LGP0_NEOID|nr:Ubiquitin and WLM domain-containing metalloprotease [Neolecta irregularis DAH-3]|eukprot:OLL21817.1 Ubiquitin and WLM domain-containing metalloprotease [Neolecta irregularis DAH-3]
MPSSFAEPGIVRFDVKFVHQVFTILLPSNGTVDDLKVEIQRQTSIPVALQKLTSKGVLLKDDSATLHSLNRRLFLVGSTREEAAAVASAKPLPEKRHTFNPPKLPNTPAKASIYKFSFLSVIESHPQSDKAMEILKRLQNDRGIQEIMDRHHWTVGHLTELDPAQYTMHNSKILGLNQNNGQTILLRLRTDNYQGFRHFKGIRATLLHELVHNEINEHNERFYALLKVLEKEVIDLDPWGGKGHDLGGEFYNPDEGGLIGGSYTLGGMVSTTGDERSARLNAALMRQNQDKKQDK